MILESGAARVTVTVGPADGPGLPPATGAQPEDHDSAGEQSVPQSEVITDSSVRSTDSERVMKIRTVAAGCCRAYLKF